MSCHVRQDGANKHQRGQQGTHNLLQGRSSSRSVLHEGHNRGVTLCPLLGSLFQCSQSLGHTRQQAAAAFGRCTKDVAEGSEEASEDLSEIRGVGLGRLHDLSEAGHSGLRVDNLQALSPVKDRLRKAVNPLAERSKINSTLLSQRTYCSNKVTEGRLHSDGHLLHTLHNGRKARRGAIGGQLIKDVLERAVPGRSDLLSTLRKDRQKIVHC